MLNCSHPATTPLRAAEVSSAVCVTTNCERACGEMVDVLWQDGLRAAAIRLEMHWNQLAMTHDFSLLCGYAMGSFYKDAGMRDVCAQHSHVIATKAR
jgi:hypothetical protein